MSVITDGELQIMNRLDATQRVKSILFNHKPVILLCRFVALNHHDCVTLVFVLAEPTFPCVLQKFLKNYESGGV